jgi:adenylate cyclase
MIAAQTLYPDEGRRLTVILAADIFGYSALMGQDELRTVHDLKSHQAVVLPMVGNCGGRVIDTAGDGIFAEFSSVQKAVRFAVALQMVMAERNRDVEPARRMIFRVGINQADVVSDETRIYGDGVNIAARLEGICAPGSIAISGKVYDEIAGLWDLTWDDAGEHNLKNIRLPVRVYNFKAGTLPPDAPEFKTEFAVSAAHPNAGSRSKAVVIDLPDVSSIAVLPFNNMSGDREQEYFADGITEDLITELSRFNDLIVIARNSTFQYKGKAVDVRVVGRELGVRYVLEGSVRKAGDRVRLTAQLINAQDGSHIWADKYDRKIEDIFAIQDELVQTITPILACQVTAAERERSRSKPAEQWQAHDIYLRAIDSFKAFADELRLAQPTARRLDECRERVAQCLALDPNHARAYALLSGTYTTKWAMQFDAEYLSPETLEKALVAVETALRLEPDDQIARAQYAHVLSFQRRRERAYAEYRTVRKRNPHFTDWRFTSICVAAGRLEEAIQEGEMLRRADPFAPRISLHFLSMANYLLGRYDRAAAGYAEIVQGSRQFAISRRFLASSLAQLGQIDEARMHAEMAIKLEPNWTFSKDFVPSSPHLMPEHIALVREGMLKAGLPE